MRILVSGATGFVGRALIARLERDRHQVVAWVRSPERARASLGTSVELLAMAGSEQELARQLGTCDAIVHLAGEPVIGKRWTEERKRALIDSRVGLAKRLVSALAKATPPPRVFVSASAVGYYGDRGDEILREDSPPGTDFLASLCDDWELAAEKAHEHGARVVCLRTGIVLGSRGGALAPLKKLFRLGLGGNLGSGSQFTSWIALEDLVEIYVRALVDSRMDGAFNATGPQPVTNAQFTRALGKALHRPTILPAPKFALRMILGEASSALLASQRVLPARLLEQGFEFEHEDVHSALNTALRPHIAH